MRTQTLVIALAAMLASSMIGVAAADPVPPSTPNASPTLVPAQVDNPDQMVCKAGIPTTGTRLGARRECHTNREWAQIQQDAQKALSQMQNGPAYGCYVNRC